MDKKFGYIIFLGTILGLVFGIFFGAGNANPIFGIGIGATFGTFIGRFIAAALQQNQNEKEK
jgi:uncharacterized protein YcfJ